MSKHILSFALSALTLVLIATNVGGMAFEEAEASP